MSAKRPTFIISNGKGSSYLFRSVIPKDLREFYNYNKELRISLQTGIKKEAIRRAGILKNQLDVIFNGIRSGNISETCVSFIKDQLQQHLNSISNPINTNGYSGVKSSLRPLGYFPEYQTNYNHQFSPMIIPPEIKLVREYVSKFKLEDIKSVCDHYSITYDKKTFPRKHIRQAREKLIKLIDEDMGLVWFANHLAEEIIRLHLEPMEYEEFKSFLDEFEEAEGEIKYLLEETDDINHGELIEAVGEHYNLIEIALNIGTTVLFKSQDLGEVSEESEESDVEEDEDSIMKVWTALNAEPQEPVATQSGDQQSEEPQTVTANEELDYGPKISAIIKEYWDEKMETNAWGPKTALEIQTVLGRMVEIVGDIPGKKLSYPSARKYKSTLMKLPPNMSKDKRYRDLSIREILKLDDVKPISTITFNNNMGFVISMMGWAKKNGYVVDNYFEGMKVVNPKKAKDQRKPFNDRDLKKIFDPETYLKETEGYDFRYWLPLLALFTGGRLGELTQLHKSDIVKEDGIWCIEITDERGTEDNPKRLKNKSSERLVPIHSQLIELGFLDYVQEQKKNKETTRLFPELTFTKADYFTRRCGRWYNQFYLRKKLRITDPQLTFHSFRHTVGNGLKQKKIQESFVAELLGHSSGDTMSFGRYGKQYRPQVLMEEVVEKISYKLDFEGLKKL